MSAPPAPTGAVTGRRLVAVERRPRLSALALGALAALALPPLHLIPLLLAFAGLVHLLRRADGRSHAFVLGWCFGFGHFTVGLYWIAIAFFTDAERFGAYAVPAVLLLCAYLALYPAIAAWLTVIHRWRSPIASALVLGLAWGATELARGVILGGFPWNLIGYAWAGSLAISQSVSVIGVLGLGMLTVAFGGLPAACLETSRRGRWQPAAATLAIVGLLWAGGAVRLADATYQPLDGIRLRLVQGNVGQHHKWQPELRADYFRRHLELSAAGGDSVTHVVWPESATPYPIERDPTVRRLIAGVVPPDGVILTGGERFDLDSEPPRAWNSLFAIDAGGAIVARYDKRDLVPFGEFMPLRDLLGRFGLKKLTHGSIDFHPGPGRRTVEVPGLPPMSPLICYESIFSGQVVDANDRPAWLLNVTNDAWFGRSSGPYQHMAMARLRAIEEGLPLVRSANTGISAVVDPYGRIEAKLGLGRTGVLDADLPAPLAQPTIFARLGHATLVPFAAALGLLALVAEILASGAFRGSQAQRKAART